ncbi:SCO4402 family protein [Nocardia lasii]|uniref:Immunity protein 35 domain-containing protein n=1 Tax=Nocardia lasii TaxID=1616107 RepID=A0ABW1JT49_9NOCA
MDGVEYPEMRAAVLAAVRALADPDYQERVWLRREYPHSRFYDDFDASVHTLYDDCVVLPDPSLRIGSILVSSEEVDALFHLGRVLTPLIDELRDAPDATYVGDPRWRAVVMAARAAAVRGACADRAGGFPGGWWPVM